MSQEVVVVVLEKKPNQRSHSLLREVGVGLMWASMGSIIGSGWLFGAQDTLITAGPAAIISWLIGAVCILVLALVHADTTAGRTGLLTPTRP
jgi:amino acid transporter